MLMLTTSPELMVQEMVPDSPSIQNSLPLAPLYDCNSIMHLSSAAAIGAIDL